MCQWLKLSGYLSGFDGYVSDHTISRRRMNDCLDFISQAYVDTQIICVHFIVAIFGDLKNRSVVEPREDAVH